MVSTPLAQAFGSKSCIFHLVHLLKARINLNGTEWLVEKDWKNFERDQKVFGTVLKIWQKNTCVIAAYLGRLHAPIRFPCILRKCVII